ncbi:winged helix-turn-helix domain-containing protein [Bradyrhizobium sp. BRP14]|nr:winged helix-turn-helix domain-containing protein [Bradyrhizobium sp. BRP14]
MSRKDVDSRSVPRVLIAVEDDTFRWFLEFAVKRSGIAVAGVGNGQALDQHLLICAPEVLVLDAHLPGFDSRTLHDHVRRDNKARTTSVIMLPVVANKAAQSGSAPCDSYEYIGRPFSPQTLVSAIAARLSYSYRVPGFPQDEVLTFQDLELNLTTHRARRLGCKIHLPPTEFRLLHQFMKDPHRVYSRDELLNAAWDRTIHVGPRTVDVHVGRLRAALNRAGGQNLIRAVRSVGYGLSD